MLTNILIGVVIFYLGTIILIIGILGLSYFIRRNEPIYISEDDPELEYIRKKNNVNI